MDQSTLAAPADKTALAIRQNLEQVETALSEFDRISAGLAALEQAHPSDLACDVTTPKGMREAIAGRAAWRDPRIAVEKARKAAKAPVLALGKDIDARASYITTKLLEGEANYDEQIKAEEARREAERQARAEAEQRRIATIQDYIEAIREHATDAANIARSSEEVRDLLGLCEAKQITPAVYGEFVEQAQAAKDTALAAIRATLARRIEQEAEAERVRAERAELERLRAEAVERERIERERIAAEQKAEADRLAAERRALEEQQAAARAEQARIEAAAAAARAEADRIAKAERDAAAEQQRARMAEEQRQIDAERARLKAQQDEQDRIAREQRAEQQRQQDEAAAARRRELEAAEAAADRVRQAAPQMLDALRQWRHAEDTDDADELTNARLSRDAAIAAAA